MTRTVCLLLLAAALGAGFASPAAGQTSPFLLRVEQGAVTTTISSGSTVTFQADAVGVPSTATLTITYLGTAGAVINSVDLLDAFNIPSTDFTVAGLPQLPAMLGQNQTLTLLLGYTPLHSRRVTGRLAFGALDGPTASNFAVNLAGVAPELAYSYTPPSGNPAVLVNGGAVVFPATAVHGSSSATIAVTNNGSGPAVVTGISSTGSAFQLSGLPLLPATINSGAQLRFTATYLPSVLENSTGSLSLQFAAGAVTFALSGSSTGPQFAYEVIRTTGTSPILPTQVIALPDALVGEKSTVSFRVRNTGNADGSITAITVQGTGYALSELPFLPLTLPAGGFATFKVTFTPTLPGQVAGRLRVGNDSFDLSAAGLGPALSYSYRLGSVTVPVAAGGTVLFTPIPVGATGSVVFTVSNTGTAPGSLTSVSISGTSTAFAVSGLPALPAVIQPDASVSFTVTFAPTAQGDASATLKVDTQSFPLAGTATPPPALPAYQFTGASGTQEPLQQPSVGLSLSSAYALPLTGTLTMTFASEGFSNDPAVQFSTGSRTVSFTIPANTTQAIFPNNSAQISFQTGTVAGTITLTPAFSTTSGINLTPALPTSLNLVVPQSAPSILNFVVSSTAASSFTVQITGYSTSRSVTQMDFQFTAVSGENLGTSSLSLPVESSFLAWYQGSTSQNYGSQFTAAVTFSLQGEAKNVSSLASAIQSVSVTLSNRQGKSASKTANLR